MTTHERRTAVGVFSDHVQADQAIAELKRAGFRDDQIGVAARDWRAQTGTGTVKKEDDTMAGEAALAGAITGAAGGALVGLGILAGVIPVIGPAIAAGTLGIILSNAAAGAAVVGLVGALVGLGIPEEEARYYEEEFKSGRVIVTVKADGRYDEALAILRRHGASDRATAQAHVGASQTHATRQGELTGTAGQRMELREEELRARKQEVEKGEVRVRKEVVTEHKTLDVPVKREEVVIERHCVTGQPSANVTDLRPGDEIRVPVKEEQVHVEKTPVVKEEVTVGKRQIQETEHVAGTVRKEEVRVEREGDVNVRTKGTDVNKGKKR